jgi:YVTN family beta-propeller protein
VNTYISADYEGVRYHVPKDDSSSRHWTTVEFDDSPWATGMNALGYETSGGTLEQELRTDIRDSLLDVNTSLYARYRFELTNTEDNFDGLKLRLKYDDGFVAFLNGEMIAFENAPQDAVWNSKSLGTRSDAEAISWVQFELDEHKNKLRTGANILAIQGLNSSLRGSDFLLAVELDVAETAFVAEPFLVGDMPAAVSNRDSIFGVLQPSERSVFLANEPELGSGFLIGTRFINYESPHVHPIDLSPSSETVAVVNTPDARVELIDATSSPPCLIASVPVGLEPVSVHFRTDIELWAVNHVSDTISIIDVPSRRTVRTIQTGDEPADVVFAGDPVRAFVTCSQENTIEVFDLTDLDAEPEKIAIEGEDPRALAVSPDGKTVYAAVFESGNSSTILAGGIASAFMMQYPPNIVSSPDSPYQGQNPPPLPKDTSVVPLHQTTAEAPEVSLIVKKDDEGVWRDDNGTDWTEFVSGKSAPLSGRPEGWDVLDNDIAMIETATGDVRYATRLMTTGMAIDVHPESGEILLVGTDAMNEVRYEPALKSRFLKVTVASVDPRTYKSTVADLNTHLDYAVQTLPLEERAKSIGDPRAVKFDPTRNRAYVAGMGSDNIAVIDSQGARLETIPVGEGPTTGLALDSESGRMFVLNRFDASVSVVDLDKGREVSRIEFFDPTPVRIKRGRKVFYNTHLTSGLGQLACASCHLDGKMDRVAWDLGDPTLLGKGENRLMTLGGITRNVEPHPMKGPMVTQTLQDIAEKGPFHWRGDRTRIEDFNPTFVDLLGNDRKMSNQEMADFKTFLRSMHFGPNPHRDLDNSLSKSLPLPGHYTTGEFSEAGQPLPNGNADRGFKSIFSRRKHPMLGGVTCIRCHSQTSGLARSRTASNHGLTNRTAATQEIFKVVQLRNLYEKVGFSTASRKSLTGFGFFHDGSVDTLERFVSQEMFALKSDQEVADTIAFLLSFSGNDSTFSSRGGWSSTSPRTSSRESHAAVGAQVSLAADLSADERRRALDEMANLTTRGEVELVARIHDSAGPPTAYVMAFDTNRYFKDGQGKSRYSTTKLSKEEKLVTLMIVQPGQANRHAFDRDGDLLFDDQESQDFLPAIPGINTPFDPLNPDATGDHYTFGPDGIPDWQNDFDGDRKSNLLEIRRGTNPADGWQPDRGFSLAATLAPDHKGVLLEWSGRKGVAYQVQGSGDLATWRDLPGLEVTASEDTQALKLIVPHEEPFYYFRLRIETSKP